MSETVRYTVSQMEDTWEVHRDDEFLGRRPKKEPAKRLAQQHAGRRVLAWVWDQGSRTYVADAN